MCGSGGRAQAASGGLRMPAPPASGASSSKPGSSGSTTVSGSVWSPTRSAHLRSSRRFAAAVTHATMRLVFTMPTTNVQPRRTFSVFGDFQFPKTPSMYVRRLNEVIQAGLPQYRRWRIFGVTEPGIVTVRCVQHCGAALASGGLAAVRAAGDHPDALVVADAVILVVQIQHRLDAARPELAGPALGELVGQGVARGDLEDRAGALDEAVEDAERWCDHVTAGRPDDEALGEHRSEQGAAVEDGDARDREDHEAEAHAHLVVARAHPVPVRSVRIDRDALQAELRRIDARRPAVSGGGRATQSCRADPMTVSGQNSWTPAAELVDVSGQVPVRCQASKRRVTASCQ